MSKFMNVRQSERTTHFPHASIAVTLKPYKDYKHFGRHEKCLTCGQEMWGSAGRLGEWPMLTRHAMQHAPDKAFDIEVQYDLIADCSVCVDGGSVRHNNDDQLECQDCGTTWDTDGRYGERNQE